MGELIAIASGKGGTGKTSVSAGLATALAAAGRRVLCIDCDVGLRNLDISLGLSQTASLSFLEVCREGCDLSLATVHPLFPGLSFLTAPMNTAITDIDPKEFAELIHQARQQFDYIILDSPAGVDAGFRLATAFADRILLVTGPSPAAIRDAGRTGEVLELMGKTNVRIIVNRINRKIASAMELTVDDVMDEAGLPLLGVIPEDMNVTLAAAFGQSLLSLTNRGAAKACQRIARRLQGNYVPITL